MRFGNSIDLTNNQILNVRLQNLASDPSSTNAGTIYFNTTTNKIRFYNASGSTWIEVSAATVSSVVGTAPIVVTPSGTTYTISIPAAASPSTNGYMLGSDKGKLDAATDLNTPSTLVIRDASGNFSAGVITATEMTITGTPTNATDAATKGYVDAARSGLDVKQHVRAATTGPISGATYGATAGTASNGQFTTMPTTIDGVTLVAGDRVLVKDQANQAQNGIYVVTTLGTGSNGVWDRASDFNAGGTNVNEGAFTFVGEGTTNADSGFVLQTANPITVGTASSPSNLVFVQFSGAGEITAGNGLTKSGNTISVLATAGGGITAAAGGISVTSIPSSVQLSITQLGTITTGTWNGTAIGPVYGGTGLSSYNLGDTLYGSAANTLAALAGNTTATKKFMSQTGTGSASAAPTWSVLAPGDYPVFVASGSSHAQGAVPDPGSTAGTLRYLREDATWVQPPNSGGTVTSVALAAGSTNGASSVFTISGSPVTGSGTLTFDFATQSPNVILAGPASGSTSLAPTFRALVNADLPVVSVAKGGTGASSLTSNGVLLGNGTSAISATTAGTANQVLVIPGGGGAPVFGQVNLASSAAIVGTLPVANGGTGATTVAGARTSLTSDITPTSAASGPSLAVKIVFVVGDGSSTSFTFTHNFGHRDIIYSLVATSSPWDDNITDIAYPTTNTVTVTFGSAPASGAYRLMLVG